MLNDPKRIAALRRIQAKNPKTASMARDAAMKSLAAVTAAPKPTAKPTKPAGKFGGKPSESLTESVYRKRREEAANARTAPAPVHPIFSKEYAAQVYAKRNHSAPVDPHND